MTMLDHTDSRLSDDDLILMIAEETPLNDSGEPCSTYLRDLMVNVMTAQDALTSQAVPGGDA